ncbi:hypothetical protein J7L06_05370 [Candidatus Bathyarchaeota archaeon]|nr:hypothetical protein [Candidatus Bathyarchaeota archaeon]
MGYPRLREDEKRTIIEGCEEVKGRFKVKALCVTDFMDLEPYGRRYFEVLAVLEKYTLISSISFKTVNNHYINYVMVDSKLFEADVRSGLLGELFSEKITFFYIPLVNEGYLKSLELELKKRLIREQITRLVIEYPELYRDFLIKPEYFLYDVIFQRCRFTPHVSWKFSRLMKAVGADKVKQSFFKAAQSLIESGILCPHNGYLKIAKSPITDSVGIKDRFTDYIKSTKQILVRYSLGALQDSSTTLFQVVKLGKLPEMLSFINRSNMSMEDPQQYIFISTAKGLASLSETVSMSSLLRKILSDDYGRIVAIERLGGILNSVYLVKFERNRLSEKVVVKRFNDWVGFKWFPLALWTLGTKNFAVLGRTRLGREYSSNKYLYERGFPVPKVIYVNLREKLLVSEFIDGKPLTDIVKRLLSENGEEELQVLKLAGRTVASAHRHGVTLGDCKPENFIVSKEGKVYFVDLEQATFDKAYSWDIAEFLYYSGHYLEPFKPASRIDRLTKEFLSGYLEERGEVKAVREASSLKFIKTFSFFTSPHVISRIANICKNYNDI